jgi:mono/diheme cytochrome c family protein
MISGSARSFEGMPKLRVHAFGLSLNGFGAGPHQDPEHRGGVELHRWALTTRTLSPSRRILSRFCAVALGCALLFTPLLTHAQPTGDPRAGRTVARQACGSCHAVQLGEISSPHASAAPFQQIADDAVMTATALNVWLWTSHPTMPNIQLTLSEKADVIAYILSLRTRSR